MYGAAFLAEVEILIKNSCNAPNHVDRDDEVGFFAEFASDNVPALAAHLKIMLVLFNGVAS